MTLYVLRHADKELSEAYNPKLRHQDPPISQKGIRQAENLVRFFEKRDITSIYISEYLRTLQTAEPLAKRLEITPILDARLNEIDNGIIEGLDDAIIMRQYPDLWNAYLEQNRDFRFPQGETGAEAQDRIVDFIEEIKALPGNSLAVSHDGLIRALFCAVVGIPVYKRFNFQIQFCGLMELAYSLQADAWRLVRFNQSTDETI